ncbi:unnamed protein product [Hymenolepis diminuta]|uniref:Uncharacterized protein n=1 Tax=Hymenolepis diminuta TaxID=6216 RepID=A0A564Y661_HYMDI|nr:unnamed protein product [Hymenolepis diminuta]
MEDFYTDLLSEIPTITANFLNQTNLETALSILGNLANTVEAVLDAHTFLRENGPQVTLELEKLDSSIRWNAEMLVREIQETRGECRDFSDQIPSLKAFNDSMNELAKGLQKEEHYGDTFFKLFHLESSLGLFNMLNVLPFNVSEVTDQLKNTIKVRDDLGASIQENMEYRFTRMMKDVAGMIGNLSAYIDKGQVLINQTERTYNKTIKDVNRALDSLKHAWIIVYFIEMMVATAPLVLLICSCMFPRRSFTVPVKEAFPLLTINNVISTSSSGCGSSEDEASTLTAQERQVVSAITLPVDGNFISTQELFLEQGWKSSVSFDSDSGCPRSDCRGEVLWSQVGTFETLGGVEVKETKASNPKHRCCKGCAHLVSFCGSLILSLICLPLVFGIGYLHVNVCLPLVPNSPQQHQLDDEINGIIEESWDDWMNLTSVFVNQYLQFTDNSTSSNFALENHLRISNPRNLVSALLTQCVGPSGNGSLFKAISLNIKLNFTGVLDIPVFRSKLIEFREYFVAQAVEMVVEKLEAGLLPPNFEHLLQALISEPNNGRSEETSSTTALDTADRFWSQAIRSASDRERAIRTTLERLQANTQILKKVNLLQRMLEQEIAHVHNSSTLCSIRLAQLLRSSRYALRLVRSRRKSFRFNEQLQGLLKAAVTLNRISKVPSFTQSLSNFAGLAYKMGLSKASSDTSIENLLLTVHKVIGMEFDRITNTFEAHLAAKAVNARIAAVLERFTAPCDRLGSIAWNAVESICIVNSPERVHQREFVPILQRMAAVGLAILLLISLYSLLCLIYICIIKSLSSK